MPAVGHAPGGRCGRPRGICSLAVTESALWPSRKVSGPRLLRLAGSLPLPNIYCFRHAVCARAANIDHPILRASFSACGGYPVRLDGLGCSQIPPCPLPNGIDDPATSRWARAQLRRTSPATVVSATDAVLRVHLGQLDQPGRCAHRGDHHGPGPCGAAGPPTGAGPGDPGRISPPPGRPITGPASARRTCSPPRCSRPAGRWRLAAAARCGRQPDAAVPRYQRTVTGWEPARPDRILG